MTWECFAAAQGVAYSGFVWEPYVRTRTISYVFQAQHREANMADISPDLFMDAVVAYQQTAAIKAAIELDMFKDMAEGNTTVESLARATGAVNRGIRILRDYLTVCGHLEKQGHQFALTPFTAAFLDRSASSWMGDVAQYLAASEMMDLFLRTPLLLFEMEVRLGQQTMHRIIQFGSNSQGQWDHRGFSSQERSPPKLRIWLPTRCLMSAPDMACLALPVAQAVTDAQITALDWPAVLSVAQETAEAAGVSRRYHPSAGNAFDADWGSGFDLVLLANFLHQLGRDACVSLLAKGSSRALSPGGRAVAVEFLPNEDRVSPRFPAMFAFQMLGSTPQGDAYTAREFEEMGRAAGFGRVIAKPLTPTPQSLILFEQA